MSTLFSIIGALVAALGVSVLALRGEKSKRVRAEVKAETLEASVESARKVAKQMEQVARSRDQRLTDEMVAHQQALSKLEKAGLHIDEVEVEDDQEKIAGLWNSAMATRQGDE